MNQKDLLLFETRKQYLAAVLRGDHEQAAAAVDGAVRSGLSVRSVYLYVFVPTQEKLGELWAEGKVSVAEEHLASHITLQEMGRLRSGLRRKPRLGRRALVTCAEGDNHLIGARIVADFLFADGWDVDFLGIDTPVDEVVDYAGRRGSDLVGISIAVTHNLDKARAAAERLRSLEPAPKVMVGGGVFGHGSTHTAEWADAVARTAQEAVDTARALVGLPPTSSYLDQYLKQVGSRISGFRRAKHLSQQQVAESSGLDRAYISAVEHGKHNLTLGAVMKLADALEVSMEDLLNQSEDHGITRSVPAVPMPSGNGILGPEGAVAAEQA